MNTRTYFLFLTIFIRNGTDHIYLFLTKFSISDFLVDV